MHDTDSSGLVLHLRLHTCRRRPHPSIRILHVSKTRRYSVYSAHTAAGAFSLFNLLSRFALRDISTRAGAWLLLSMRPSASLSIGPRAYVRGSHGISRLSRAPAVFCCSPIICPCVCVCAFCIHTRVRATYSQPSRCANLCCCPSGCTLRFYFRMALAMLMTVISALYFGCMGVGYACVMCECVCVPLGLSGQLGGGIDGFTGCGITRADIYCV